jgi:1,5-anhydro-D-fructose reductase (1,5-anhydro-D-mannitol-forming)
MIRAGIIGLGFMGGAHLRNWQALEGAGVVAVCDANPIGGTARQGNIDTGSDALDLDGVAVYSDVGEMLASETLDAVSIALPTHLHKAISIQCLEAGVHVLCEKPMALNVEDCDAMITAAARAGKHLMVAHCIRFWPEYAWVKKAVEGGEYGDVVAADFSRLTYAPVWADDSWLADPAKSGGIALDLHIHDLDFIQYLFGSPLGIRSVGTRHVQTQVDYGDGRAISATASWMMPESFGFRLAFNPVFEKAAAVFDGTALTVYPETGDPFAPELAEGDGYKREIDYFAEWISGTAAETVITPEQARESVRLALETME